MTHDGDEHKASLDCVYESAADWPESTDVDGWRWYPVEEHDEAERECVLATEAELVAIWDLDRAEDEILAAYEQAARAEFEAWIDQTSMTPGELELRDVPGGAFGHDA